MVYCTRCGASNPDGAAFCSRCGASLTQVSTPPATPPPVSAATAPPFAQAQPVQAGLPQQNGKATASLVLGIIGLVACAVPILGFPITIIGIILGGIGLKSQKHGQAVAGLVMSILGLIGSIVWAVIGAVIGLATFGAFGNL